MSSKRAVKKVVFGIQENQCIWVKAGVVNFKICQNSYDCTSCSFDKAMQLALKEGDAFSSWRQEMTKKKASERLCRHVLTGFAPVRICGNAYNCSSCEFDQLVEEKHIRGGDVSPDIRKIDGFDLAQGHFYHPGHVWIRSEYGGLVRIGMDDFAWRLLGFVDEIRLPEIGFHLNKSEKGWILRREEKIAPCTSPVEGVVVARNYRVLKDPNKGKMDPYGEGWLMMVDPLPSAKDCIKGLMDDEEAEKWAKREYATLSAMVEEVYGMPMAATGGEISDDIYGNLKQIGWDKLVEKFLIRV